MSEFERRGARKVRVADLKPYMNNISVSVRVLEASEARTINTKSGIRTISEAVVGDESGRVKVTLWGKAAGSLKGGEAVEISSAWTTVYRGDIQLNVGGQNNIKAIDDSEVPKSDEIPEESPKAPEGFKPRRPPVRRRFGGSRGFR